MCSRRLQQIFLALAMLIVMCNASFANDSEAPQAQGPYFRIDSGDPALDRLPLKSTRAAVRIVGVIADVTVVQRYSNEGQRAIEARYVFPGSTQSAVNALSVRLGKRLIVATIRERQQARIEYEQAKSEGRTSALLEQERPNVFSMNVANILPGDEVEVELRYSELLAPTEGRYEFVFPTVVGPRYHSPGASPVDMKFPAMPFLRANEPPKAAFDLDVTFDSPLPVTDIVSTSHDVTITGQGSRGAKLRLDPNGGVANDRDFILAYRLSGERTATGLMLYKGQDENFFLAMIEPPKTIRPVEINPREYLFVVDVSGSMWGYPLDTAKELLRNLIGKLRPTDTFNVMTFSGGNRMLNPQSVPATEANIDQAFRMLSSASGSGGTEIVPALRRIAQLPRSPDLSRTIIVVTDGYVTVENEVFQLVRRNLGDANLFAFGIGTSVNRHLIEGLARAGQGEPFIVTRPSEASAQAERLRRMIDSPVLTQLRARFEGIDAYDVWPQALPDVLGGRPVVIMGKWRGNVAFPNTARIVLDGRKADGPWRATVNAPMPSAEAKVLPLLWARGRIGQLSDEEALVGDDSQRFAITELGLKYSLLTQYTSFIAVDKVVRNPNGLDTVDQPSPLPAGVAETAVGAGVPSTPEPQTYLALLVALAALGWVALRTRRVRVQR